MNVPAYKAWYKTYRWQQLRKRHLEANPLCVMCQAEGRVKQATVCDHVKAHRGDPVKFWSGPFQGLCAHHHSSTKQIMEKSGRSVVRIGMDGYPIEDQQVRNVRG